MDDKNNDSKMNPEYDETVAGKEGWNVSKESSSTPTPDAPSSEDVANTTTSKGNPDYDERVAGKEGWKVIGADDAPTPATSAPEDTSNTSTDNYDETVAGKEGWNVSEESSSTPTPDAPSSEDVANTTTSKGNPDYNERVAGKEGWKIAGEETTSNNENKSNANANNSSNQVAPTPVVTKNENEVKEEKEDESKKLLAGILGIVLAIFGLFFGIHNYIYGYTSKGIIQTVLYVIGWVTACFGIGIIILIADFIWCLVESILILTGSIKPAPKNTF